jgi:hypothetical protein
MNSIIENLMTDYAKSHHLTLSHSFKGQGHTLLLYQNISVVQVSNYSINNKVVASFSKN